ncbi:glycosyltransferase family 2 protein [Shewanella xiamenensis]|uniref:glycosyltransferase family 2 protein n=1 Tax=Shewanella xiamenensis TaxID=332186 RepID=UPI0035BA435F
MKNIEVAVLMSTFNGAFYLKEQLESLRCQTYSNFILYVRDDGSSDETLNIIKNFEGLNIRIVEDSVGNVGPASSFLRLLSCIEADYYFFCDQDDVWFNDKIERAILHIEESADSDSMSILYHSDLTLVDSNLNNLGSSFHNYDKVNPEEFVNNNILLIQNCVVGCTSAFNRNLRDMAINYLPIDSRDITMHDWWLALFARYFGVLLYDPKPSIYYRQHQSNVSGSSIKSKKLFSRVFKLNSYKKIFKMIDNCKNQMELFLFVVSTSGLKLPDDVLRHAQKIMRGSFISYISLYLDGVRFSNWKLTFSLAACCLLLGRWL